MASQMMRSTDPMCILTSVSTAAHKKTAGRDRQVFILVGHLSGSLPACYCDGPAVRDASAFSRNLEVGLAAAIRLRARLTCRPRRVLCAVTAVAPVAPFAPVAES
jgi:hypothetical protein